MLSLSAIVKNIKTSLNKEISDRKSGEDEIKRYISSAVRWRGSVDTYSALPSSDLTLGDMYNIVKADKTNKIEAGDNVVWNGSSWDVMGGMFDDSSFAHLNADVTFNSVTAKTITGNASTSSEANHAAEATHADTATVVDGGVLNGSDAKDIAIVTMADNDAFRIRVGGITSDDGYAELATSDNGTEPIYVRQYTGG